MHSRAGLLLLLLFAMSGMSQDHPRSTTRPIGLRPDDGTFINGVYKNGYFGLSFSMGEDWFENDEWMQIERLRRQKLFPHISCLLIAERNPSKAIRERIELTAYDKETARSTAEEWVRSMATTMVAGGDHEWIRNTYPVDYGGQHFYRADIKANYFGKVSYMTFLANEYGGFLFDWVFEANSKERMNQIINSLNSLSFADRHH